MLSTNQYVRVFSFDFTKAFDTVRHETLMSKMATLRIPDNIYNWINDFFGEHYHCTRFDGQCSSVAEVKASVIQGSALGPASYVVTAADLHPVTPANRIFKYADDTYLVVSAANSRSCLAEIAHIDEWAATNNLKLNCAKSKKIIITARGKRGKSVQPPPPCSNIERVSSLRVLGVIPNDKLTTTGHVDNLLSASTGLMYALRVLHSHGIPPASLHDVFRATVVSKITYCSPAWSGMCSAADRARLDAFLNRCKRLGFCDKDLPSATELFSDADDALFERINTNSQHVLQRYLPDRPDPHYSLRERSHNKSLITKSSELSERDFLIRILYKHCY